MRKIMIGIIIAGVAMLGASNARRGMGKLHDRCTAKFRGAEPNVRHDDEADPSALASSTNDHGCTC
jgi:hypothetical protein